MTSSLEARAKSTSSPILSDTRPCTHALRRFTNRVRRNEPLSSSWRIGAFMSNHSRSPISSQRLERSGDLASQRKLPRRTSDCRWRRSFAHQDSFSAARVAKDEVALPATLEDSTASSHRPQDLSSMVLSPPLLPPAHQSFLLVGSITIMVMCGAFVALVITAIPTLNAMRRAALSLEKLADMARQELPGTMAAIRLSGMEISDLTLELSDLSQEISESVRSSAHAVRAAEVGIRRMGSAAASQTLSMLQEHASGSVEAVKPVVATAAETTRQAVTQAQRAVQGLAGMPVLSKWIQKKKIEEQKKIEEGLPLETSEDSYDVDGDSKVDRAS